MKEGGVAYLPDDAVEVFEVRLDLLHRLLQQPAVGTHTHVGHPVDGDQGLHQPAHGVEGGLRRLEQPHLVLKDG